MRPYKYLFLHLLVTVSTHAFSQTENSLISHEKAYEVFFSDFVKHAKEDFKKVNSNIKVDSAGVGLKNTKNSQLKSAKGEFNDSAEIQYMLSNYIVDIDVKSNLSKKERVRLAGDEIHDFEIFLNANNFDDLAIQPLRIDTSINAQYVFSQMAEFQKENTYVLFDKNSPEKLLAFILIVPGKTIKSTSRRILSWKLTFAYGHYYFLDIFGRIGTEYLWEKIAKSQLPVNIRQEFELFNR